MQKITYYFVLPLITAALFSSCAYSHRLTGKHYIAQADQLSETPVIQNAVSDQGRQPSGWSAIDMAGEVFLSDTTIRTCIPYIETAQRPVVASPHNNRDRIFTAPAGQMENNPVLLLPVNEQPEEPNIPVSAILGLVFACIPGFSILGLILSFVALQKIKKDPQQYRGKGLATAGIIISVIVTLIFIVFIALVIELMLSVLTFGAV